MFINTHTTAFTLLAQTTWMISSSLATCAYSLVMRNRHAVIGNTMPSKLRQRHEMKSMRSEDPQMRH